MRILTFLTCALLPRALVAFVPPPPRLGQAVVTTALRATQEEKKTSSSSAAASSEMLKPNPPDAPPASHFFMEEENRKENELFEAVVGVTGAVAKEVFGAVRWTAANVLTSALPEDEREELLNRMESKGRPSVGENIAAAAAQESRRADKWESEKEEILKQAELAAKQRVENELAIQRQRLEKEQQALKAQTLEQEKINKEELAGMEQVLRQKEEQSLTDKEIIENLNRQLLAANREQNKIRADLKAAEQNRLRQEDALAELQEEKERLMNMTALSSSTGANMTAFSSGVNATVVASSGVNQTASSVGNQTVDLRRYSAREYRDLSDEQKEELKALRDQYPEAFASDIQQAPAQEKEKEEDVHPILGPIVQDLGYKRLHLVSAGKLGTIPIWKKQRIYRHDRVKSMADDKWKSMELGIPGVICLHEDKDGQLSILDGQHRVGMMMLLREKQRKQQQQQQQENATKSDESSSSPTQIIDFDKILVEVYPEKEGGEDHARDLFLEINKAEPVKLIDMPGVAKATDRTIITDAVDRLYEKYPRMFSPSQRCQLPNVNAENLRNSLYGSGVLKRHNLKSSKQLFDWLLQQNVILARKYERSDDERSFVAPVAWEKAKKNEFYLGLSTAWLFQSRKLGRD